MRAECEISPKQGLDVPFDNPLREGCEMVHLGHRVVSPASGSCPRSRTRGSDNSREQRPCGVRDVCRAPPTKCFGTPPVRFPHHGGGGCDLREIAQHADRVGLTLWSPGFSSIRLNNPARPPNCR
jgi:hypothetical protein